MLSAVLFFALLHQAVDELRRERAAVLRIGRDLSFLYLSSSWHSIYPDQLGFLAPYFERLCLRS